MFRDALLVETLDTTAEGIGNENPNDLSASRKESSMNSIIDERGNIILLLHYDIFANEIMAKAIF